MSHLVRVALAALTAALACASPTPPAPDTPEPSIPEPSAPPSTEPSTSPASDPPAAVSAPEAAPAVEARLFVREQRVDCQGEGPKRCLQVRESESAPWRNLYATISGFDYEESNAYELRVEVSQVPHPPADAASVRYRLLEVVSKRKVAPSAGK